MCSYISHPYRLVPENIDSCGIPRLQNVFDYRNINEPTVSYEYPSPNISDSTDEFYGDSDIYQIEIEPNDI